MKKLLSFLFCCFLFLSIQQTSDAQIFVQNNTSCTLYIYAGQAGPPPCSLCTTTPVVVAPGFGVVTQVAAPNPFCGPEFWKGIVFNQSPLFLFGTGYTYNPVVPFPYTCGTIPPISGLCGVTSITGNVLSPGGLGPQFIVVQ